MYVSTRLGQRIRQLRRLAGFTQESLANDLSMSPSHLRKIERGLVNTTVETAAQIFSYLLGELASGTPPVLLVPLDEVLANQVLWRYRLTPGSVRLEGLGWCPIYGITVLRRRHGGWAKADVLRDVSPRRETALAIVSRLDEAQVSPLHLADAVADLLP